MTALKVTAWLMVGILGGLALAAGYLVGAVIAARGEGR